MNKYLHHYFLFFLFFGKWLLWFSFPNGPQNWNICRITTRDPTSLTNSFWAYFLKLFDSFVAIESISSQSIVAGMHFSSMRHFFNLIQCFRNIAFIFNFSFNHPQSFSSKNFSCWTNKLITLHAENDDAKFFRCNCEIMVWSLIFQPFHSFLIGFT